MSTGAVVTVIVVTARISLAPVLATQSAASSGSVALPSGTTSINLPPGVSYDASVHPLAGPSASWQQKCKAVMAVANSKLGTPYIWGHNEDRGPASMALIAPTLQHMCTTMHWVTT